MSTKRQGRGTKPTSSSDLGIAIERDPKINVDWTALSANVLEFLAKTVFSSATTGNVASGTSNLLAATKAIRADMEIGEKLWHISMLSFGWALSEVIIVRGGDENALSKKIKELIKLAGERVDLGQEIAPLSFISRPTQLPLYKFLRQKVVDHKNLFRPGVNESDEVVSWKVDSAYDRAIFEVFLRRPEIFDSVLSVSSQVMLESAQKQLDWSAYRQRLAFDFTVRPVFGQESSRLSLSQLYIPLRGYWRKNDDLPADIAADHYSGHHEYGWVEPILKEWIAGDATEDCIRLIGGGPGSGKSTTLRSLASGLAAHPEVRPLFVPLQHISLDGDLREAINRYFSERTSGDFHHPPLGRSYVEDGPPIVLIFDGLDEIARPGEAANEVVGLFAAKLTNLVTALRGDGQQKLKVIVSGRMPAFQAAKRYLTPPREGCIEVYGYTPLPGNRDDQLGKVDQRKAWWEQYANLVGLAPEIPPAFSSEKLSGLTHEPLLCYLLVLSGFAIENWEKAAENPNIIYRQLVDSIWDRGWGEGAKKRQGAGRSLSKHDFNVLMQTIAIAAWQGGDTRVASEAGFQAAIGIARAESAWESFKHDNGPDVTNLAMNFYLKAAEEGHRGFEFTHKSFGDYLAARAVLDIAMELPNVVFRKVDHALVDWVEATSTGVLTNEILYFLRDEARLRIAESGTADKIIEVKKSFEVLINTVLIEGMPVQGGGHTWRAAEQRQANAESMAWAVVNALSLALASVENEERAVKIAWPNPKESFLHLLKRLTRVGLRDAPALKCFSYVVAPDSLLFGMAISSIDLRGAQMPNSNFNGCHLINANLENGMFERSSFERAMLDSARMDGGEFKSCNFVDARLTHSSIGGANFEGSTISALTLMFSSLDDLLQVGPVFRRSIGRGVEEDEFWARVPAAKKAQKVLTRDV